VPFSQTCDEDLPQLITHVETTHAALPAGKALFSRMKILLRILIHDHAALPDGKALFRVHTDSADKDLLPDQHLVDAAAIDAANLHESRVSYEVDLVGPTLKHDCYQAGTDYDLTHFSIDWDAQTVTCPVGHLSSSWTPAQDPKGRAVITIKFSQSDCRACPSQIACTGQSRRTLTGTSTRADASASGRTQA
jgi:transposase